MKDGQCLPLANTEYIGVGGSSIGVIVIIVLPVNNCWAQPGRMFPLQEQMAGDASDVPGTTGSIGPLTHRGVSRGLIPRLAHYLCEVRCYV